jgi:hypothetical protein
MPLCLYRSTDMATITCDQRILATCVAMSFILVFVPRPLRAVEPTKPAILPRECEMKLALSAAPAHLREAAAVYVLEAKGFVKIRESGNHFSCIVNRDHALDLRPTCYDAEGSETILPKVLQVGAWLMAGKSQQDIRHLLAEGFSNGTYIAPRRPGVAYMLSGENRNFDPQTGKVTRTPPHVMFYAPNLTNEDIGSTGAVDEMPYIAGTGPHSFMIMMAPQTAGEPLGCLYGSN